MLATLLPDSSYIGSHNDGGDGAEQSPPGEAESAQDGHDDGQGEVVVSCGSHGHDSRGHGWLRSHHHNISGLWKKDGNKRKHNDCISLPVLHVMLHIYISTKRI